MPEKNKNKKSSSVSRNLHWVTRPSASVRDLALWGADVLGAPSHITNAVRDVSNRVANLPIIGLDAAYNYVTGNNDTWAEAFKEADTNPSALASAFEVFPITNTKSNYSDAQLANQYELRKHSPGKPGQITHDGYRYINQGRYAGDVGVGNFFSPSKVNEWSIGQTAGVEDEEGNTYTSDLFAYDTKDTDNVYLKAIKEGKASPAMFLRGALGVVGAKGYDDGTNSATSIRTKIDTKAQKKAYDNQNKKAEGGSLKSSWDDLSWPDKAQMIKVAVKNGITDLSTIRQKYNEFAEGGDISDEQYYAIMEKVAEENNPIWNKQRIAEGGKPLSVEEDLIRILNDNSYDYRGFYNKYPPTAADANSHWTDEFKTAYHPTFSDQSKFSGKKSQYNPYGYRGGHWVGETFFPEIWQTANYYLDGGPKRTPTVEELKARIRESEERWEKRKREEAEYRRKYEAMSAEEKAALNANPSLHGEALVSALDSMAKVPITGEAYSKATEKQREKDLEKWHETKNILEGTTTAAELLAAGYGVGRGLLQLGKMGAKRMGRTTLETALEEAVKRASKYQGVMNGIGTGVDVAQLTDAVVNKNTFDTVENAVEAGAGTAGIIGATDKFRNIPFFGRNINTIDNILDAAGYGAAAWDIVKQLPPLSGALEHIKEEVNSNNKSKVYKKK